MSPTHLLDTVRKYLDREPGQWFRVPALVASTGLDPQMIERLIHYLARESQYELAGGPNRGWSVRRKGAA